MKPGIEKLAAGNNNFSPIAKLVHQNGIETVVWTSTRITLAWAKKTRVRLTHTPRHTMLLFQKILIAALTDLLIDSRKIGKKYK
jgi:hypothetical protein